MNVRITSSQKHTLHPGVWRVGLVDTAEHARRLQHLRLCARCPGLFCHTIFTQRRHTNVKATPPASFCTTPRSAWNSKTNYYNYIGTRHASTVEQDVRLYMGFIVYMCWNKTGVDMRDILYTCIGVRCASILEIYLKYCIYCVGTKTCGDMRNILCTWSTQWVYIGRLFVVSAGTNKRHHHHWNTTCVDMRNTLYTWNKKCVDMTDIFEIEYILC
jgi:hypothetical protein